MNRLMIVARLREGAHEEAEALLAGGPAVRSGSARPAPARRLLTRPRSRVSLRGSGGRMDRQRHHRRPGSIAAAFGPWEKLIEGTPRLAHERFYWSRESSKLGVGLGV